MDSAVYWDQGWDVQGAMGSLFINENKTQEEKLKHGRKSRSPSSAQFMEVMSFLKGIHGWGGSALYLNVIDYMFI